MTDPRTTAELSHLRHLANENGSTISFLKQIIKENRLHERNCIAFTLPKEYSGALGFTAGMFEKECHCWLDKDNRAPEGHAFAYFHIRDKELAPTGYVNRYYAVQHLLEDHPELSAVRTDPNHWSKTYYIVEVSINPQESAE
jgi:hypothetical protein